MICSGVVLAFTGVPVQSDVTASSSYKVCRITAATNTANVVCSSSSSSSSSSGSNSSTVNIEHVNSTSQKFRYSRATPSVRWPNLKITETYQSDNRTSNTSSTRIVEFDDGEDDFATSASPRGVDGRGKDGNVAVKSKGGEYFEANEEALEVLGRPSKTRAKKMTKLALKRAKDWRQRVQYLTDRILGLKSEEFVADVLDDRIVQMTPTDFCFVVKWVGQASWQRALEIYEWLNLRHWFSPNARMLATVLSVLGKANQESLAIEIFTRAESGIGDTVQVYNAMMGVYARNGRFNKVVEMLDMMRTRGCEPDLVSFNTMINARLKSGPMGPNLAIDLLNEVKKSGLRPDIITYNTLISACSRESNLEEAVKIYSHMETHACQSDLWTYNAMISVYGRCGLPRKAEVLFKELEGKGFFPDAVTYNSLLYAFAREGDVQKVNEICEEMVKKGFGQDEMTYNTMIHMHGKKGQHDVALKLYNDMKLTGRSPDVVTYTVLIDSLGKSNRITEAANVMSELLDAGLKPTLRTFSALMCGYAKAGKCVEAEETYKCMLKSGIKPDLLAYSVMLDVLSRSNETKKAMALYQEMIRDGFLPDSGLYEVIVQALGKEDRLETIDKVVKDMKDLSGMNPQVISSILIKGNCYDHGAKMLRSAIEEGFPLNRDNLLSILKSYSSSRRHLEAQELLDYLSLHATEHHQLISEARVVIFCEAQEVDSALGEYDKLRELANGSLTMYQSLIQCCEKRELYTEASQVFSDMRFHGVQPSEIIYRKMVHIYCQLGFPETGCYLVDQAEKQGTLKNDISLYIELIDTYGKLKLWQKAESLVGSFKQRAPTVDRKIWNALIEAYASSGCYERGRAIFNTMMRDGPYPTVDSMNGLLRALIVDGRLDELYVVIEELQDMGFKISKSSILLMLEAFVQVGNIPDVKKIYSGMKAAGYFPTMHLYRIMIGLLSRGKRVQDVEAMVLEMEEGGFKPDLSVLNCLLKLYTGIGDYKKTVQVYQRIQEDGLTPDEDSYNTLILMYCRELRPEEGLSLMHEMKRLGLDPTLNTYKSLIAAFAKQQRCEPADELFEEMQSRGLKLDRSFYHIMMKMFRSSGNHSKAETLLAKMTESGVEPSAATMHLLMVSYGTSGQPEEAEKVLDNLKVSGLNISTLPYSSVINSYLRNGDYGVGIQKLVEMKKDGVQPDHRIWTCFVRAASLADRTSDALMLLNALRDVGFDLPVRLLTEKSDSLVLEVDRCLETLEPVEDNAAFNFVNALGDLLWAFELRATASWVFQLAIKRRIYRDGVFRVAEKDWGADFRKLSAGSALVALTLWLDHMQDASLQGSPESPKSVVLITGTSEYNMVSLNSTLKAYLWEMGSPFLPCKTRTGLLIAKAHSLRMWLNDSPFCFDLELKDASSLPDFNSMKLMEGCFIRRGLVHAFKDITGKLGVGVWPKKFARLALLSDDKRERVMQADIQGRQEKMEKMKKSGLSKGVKIDKHPRRKFVRSHPVKT